jgi:hypothetical protein
MYCWRKHVSQPNYEFMRDTRTGFGQFIKIHDHGPVADPLRHARRSNQQSASQSRSKYQLPAREVDWQAYLDANGCPDEECLLLANEILGAHPDTLRRLEIGYCPETMRDWSTWETEPPRWIFPERDADGKVIGILRRYYDGDKKRMLGSRSGIVFDPQEDYAGRDLILIVEGPSDVAAAWSMGLVAFGRPNNLGGSEILAPLIRKRVPENVRIVVLGENDKKPDGSWPGLDGAKKVSAELSRLLGRAIPWTMPPEGFKDLRKWFIDTNVQTCDVDACRDIGKLLLKTILQSCVFSERPYTIDSVNVLIMRIPGKVGEILYLSHY